MSSKHIVHGELHGSTGSVQTVLFYLAGLKVARTIAANEQLHIDSVHVVAVGAGDVQVFFDDVQGGPSSSSSGIGTIDGGEMIMRGTGAANAVMVQTFPTPRVGFKGATVKVIAPNAVVDVILTGWIEQVL